MGRPGEVKLKVLRARMPELFPALIRRYRNARGLLVKDLAEVLGVSISEMKRFEEGFRLPPGHEGLNKLARRLSLASKERIDLFTAAAIDRRNLDVDGLDREDVAQLVALADLMRASKRAGTGPDQPQEPSCPRCGGPSAPGTVTADTWTCTQCGAVWRRSDAAKEGGPGR